MIRETIRSSAVQTLDIYKQNEENPIHFDFSLDSSFQGDIEDHKENPSKAIYDQDKFVQFSRVNKFFSTIPEFL